MFWEIKNDPLILASRQYSCFKYPIRVPVSDSPIVCAIFKVWPERELCQLVFCMSPQVFNIFSLAILSSELKYNKPYYHLYLHGQSQWKQNLIRNIKGCCTAVYRKRGPTFRAKIFRQRREIRKMWNGKLVSRFFLFFARNVRPCFLNMIDSFCRQYTNLLYFHLYFNTRP